MKPRSTTPPTDVPMNPAAVPTVVPLATAVPAVVATPIAPAAPTPVVPADSIYKSKEFRIGMAIVIVGVGLFLWSVYASLFYRTIIRRFTGGLYERFGDAILEMFAKYSGGYYTEQLGAFVVAVVLIAFLLGITIGVLSKRNKSVPAAPPAP